MQTVAELHAFRRAARSAGLTDADIHQLVLQLATNPERGDLLQGTGGCRKFRFASAASGRGKSGGVRVITFYAGLTFPVFLITVFAKNKKVTLTEAERNQLGMMTDRIRDAYAAAALRRKSEQDE